MSTKAKPTAPKATKAVAPKAPKVKKPTLAELQDQVFVLTSLKTAYENTIEALNKQLDDERDSRIKLIAHYQNELVAEKNKSFFQKLFGG